MYCDFQNYFLKNRGITVAVYPVIRAIKDGMTRLVGHVVRMGKLSTSQYISVKYGYLFVDSKLISY
jgi:hypothetical protein